jgi:DNA-binding NtrC family response regulator
MPQSQGRPSKLGISVFVSWSVGVTCVWRALPRRWAADKRPPLGRVDLLAVKADKLTDPFRTRVPMTPLSVAASSPVAVPPLGGGTPHKDLPIWLANSQRDESAPVTPGRARVGSGGLKKWRILWIDDEVDVADPLLRLLALHGFRVEVARSAAEGLASAGETAYEAVILDLHLPDMFGLTVLQRLRASGIAAPVLVVTGHYLEAEMEANAMQAGAAAFRYKPFLDAEDLAAVLRSIIEGSAPSAEDGEPVQASAVPLFGIVAVSPAMRRIVEWIGRVGPTNASALLTGETGTGKELVARALHQTSSRRTAPFVAVNCGAIPESLVETELFGHRKGAFTGAVSDKEGVFEAAHRGTLFLDEIGDLPLPMQASLLRSLDDGEVRRVGDTKTRRVDVRVIAATNRSLRQDIAESRFRGDLYYRIAMAHAELPPLRERLEDIDALIRHWLPGVSQRWHRQMAGVTPGALDLLRAYPWPGNVRELHNVLQRSVCVASGKLLSERDVSDALYDAVDGAFAKPVDSRIPKDVRRILAALDEHHWNHSKAARSLGINRSTLWRRLTRYGLGKRNEAS